MGRVVHVHVHVLVLVLDYDYDYDEDEDFESTKLRTKLATKLGDNAIIENNHTQNPEGSKFEITDWIAFAIWSGSMPSMQSKLRHGLV